MKIIDDCEKRFKNYEIQRKIITEVIEGVVKKNGTSKLKQFCPEIRKLSVAEEKILKDCPSISSINLEEQTKKTMNRMEFCFEHNSGKNKKQRIDEIIHFKI